LKLPSTTLLVPTTPIDVQSGAYFVWPVNLDLNGALLKYSTAQLLCRVTSSDATYYFFFAVPGVAPEFVFEKRGFDSVEAPKASLSGTNDQVRVSGVRPATDVAISLRSRGGRTTKIVVLSEAQARNIWKTSINGKDRILISPADVFFDGGSVHLRARQAKDLNLGIFPAGGQLSASAPFKKAGIDGVFARYVATLPSKQVEVKLMKVRDASPPAPLRMAKPVNWRQNPIPLVPEDSEFAQAAIYRVVVPEHAMKGLSDVFLNIEYTGDIGRLYEGDRLLDDDFYKGTSWEVGLKRFALSSANPSLELRILPLREGAPIYLPRAAWPAFTSKHALAEVHNVRAFPEYEVVLKIGD